MLHPDKALVHNATVVAPVKAGDVLADKYCVERILGIGGMGVVVAAEHVALGQKVALKFMLPDALADESAVARFMREARAAVKLRSEHVARVLDVGCLETGAPYIVMEFLEGEDMEDVIRRDAPMRPGLAVDFVLQACMAMAEAHSIGIVHRDLKPANLFVTKRPDGSRQVKVLDFGISKVAGGNAEVSHTKSSTAMGSPGYMAPEQMRDAKNADHRADIWALGTILYKMLSKKLPFQAESAPEMFAAVLTGQSIPLPSVAPGVEPALAEVIHRCLERDRELRYDSIAALAKALAPYGNDRAAHMAASIANVGVGAAIATQPDNPNARYTSPIAEGLPSKPATEKPEADAASDLPSTRLLQGGLAQAATDFAENPLTTRRASAGQAVVTAPHTTEESTPATRGRFGMGVAAVAIAAVALLVGLKTMSGGSDGPVEPATGEAAQVSDAALHAPQAVSIDAGAIHAGLVDGGPSADLAVTPADAAPVAVDVPKPAPRRTRRTRPTSQPQPKPKPEPDTEPKPKPKPEPDTKPKPKPNDDPFGTMQ